MVAKRLIKGLLLLAGIGILVLVITAVVLLSLYEFGMIMLLVDAILIVIIAGAFVLHSVYVNRGVRTVLHLSDSVLYEHKCTRCTGGAQSLNENGWGPIPKRLRLVQDGDDMFHSPMANVRRCPNCQGLGNIKLPYPPAPLDIPEILG